LGQAGEQSGDTTFNFTLTDQDSDLCSINCYYSTDLVNYTTATVSGDITNLTSSSTGESHSIIWNSESDLSDFCDTVIFKILPSDLYNEGTFDTEQFTLDNKVPSGVIPSSPSDESTEIAINTSLSCSTGTDDNSPILYNFRIAEDDEFTSGLLSRGWNASATWTLSSLKEGTVYYWQVKAKDSLDNDTGWVYSDVSEIWSFVTEDMTPPVLTNLIASDGYGERDDDDFASATPALDVTTSGAAFTIDCTDSNSRIDAYFYYKWNDATNYMMQNMTSSQGSEFTYTLDTNSVFEQNIDLDWCYDLVSDYDFELESYGYWSLAPYRIDSEVGFGKALDFNNGSNDEYYSELEFTESDSIYDLGNQFSVSFWVKLDSNGYSSISANDYRTFIDCDAFAFGQLIASDQFFFRVRNPGPTGTINSGDEEVQFGNWYHIVGVRDNAMGYLYINGELINSQSGLSFDTQLDDSNNKYLRLATKYTDMNRHMDGALDDILIVKDALSLSEVEELYKSEACPSPENTLLRWNFNEFNIDQGITADIDFYIKAVDTGNNSASTSEYSLDLIDFEESFSLSQPVNGSEDVSSTPSLSCTAASSAFMPILYDFRIQENAEPTSVSLTRDWDSSTTWTITSELNPQSTYNWQIRAKNAVGNATSWKSVPSWTFETGVGNYPPTISVQTIQGCQTGNVTISYTVYDNESDTLSITAEYSTDGTLWYTASEGTGSDGKSGLASSSGGTNHTFVWNSVSDENGIESDTVRIRIEVSDINAGESEDTGTFSLDNKAPSGVIPSSPSDESTEIAINTSFSCSTGTDVNAPILYDFRLAEDDEFTSGLLSRGWDASTSWTLSSLKEGTVYYWQVKAKDSLGHDTDWVYSEVSEIWSFVTEDLTSPVLTNLIASDGYGERDDDDFASATPALDVTSNGATFTIDCTDSNSRTDAYLYYKWNDTTNYMMQNMTSSQGSEFTYTIDTNSVFEQNIDLDWCYDLVSDYDFELQSYESYGKIPYRIDSKEGFGKALDFDNEIKDYYFSELEFTESDSIYDLGNQFSVSLWVKLDSNGYSSTSTNDYRAFIDCEAFIVGQLIESEKLVFRIRSENPEIGYSITGDTNIQFGNWYHIVGVRDNDMQYLYIDGELIDSQNISLDTKVNAIYKNLRLATKYDNKNRHMDGALDDILIVKDALSQNDVEELYKSEASPSPENTILRWNFNDFNIDQGITADIDFFIKAVDTGNNSDSTSEYSLDLIDFEESFSLLQPVNGSEDVSSTPSLSCTAANSAFLPILYDFRIQENAEPTSVSLTRDWDSSTTWTITTELNAHRTYKWQIRAKNAVGNTTSWKSVPSWTFETEYKMITMISNAHATDLVQDHYEPELWMEPYQKLDDRMITIYVDCSRAGSDPDVEINYRWDESTQWESVEMTKQSGDTFYYNIDCSELTGTHELHFYLFAWDDEGYADATDIFRLHIYDIEPKIEIIKPVNNLIITGN